MEKKSTKTAYLVAVVVIIALLALYAVWSARKIMRLSAVLHILVRMLGEMLEEEPQDLTNSADRLY